MKIWKPPDAELAVIKLLNQYSKILGCEASSVKGDPATWIQVRSTGGGIHSTVADWCQITLTAWAGKNQWGKARELAGLARGLIEKAVESGEINGIPCYGTQIAATPYNDPDPLTGAARVSQTIRIALRGTYIAG